VNSTGVYVNDNRGSAVLRAVLELGSAPRSAVARHVGLSPATVTSQSRRLIEAGLLVELPDTTTAGVGRPFIPLAVDADANVALALHIAAGHSTVAAVDIAGRLLHRSCIAHTSGDPNQILESASTEIARSRELLPESTRIIGLGVATGGWVDSAAGVVIEHAVLGWTNVPVREMLSARTGLRTEIDSHARALVHAEYLFGREHGAASTVVLFVGNVIDTAFAVHGQVHYGQRAAAGSIAGLVIGAHGAPNLRAFSDAALTARAIQTGVLASPDMSQLLEVAAAPGSPANALFVQRATALGRMAATLIDLLNPDSFIVVDRAFEAPGVRAAYRDAVRIHSVTRADPRNVVGSSFSGWVLPAAAGAVVLWCLYTSPLAMLEQAA
jgi:predicted NBD/HSP70 family sugar kinase